MNKRKKRLIPNLTRICEAISHLDDTSNVVSDLRVISDVVDTFIGDAVGGEKPGLGDIPHPGSVSTHTNLPESGSEVHSVDLCLTQEGESPVDATEGEVVSIERANKRLRTSQDNSSSDIHKNSSFESNLSEGKLNIH